MSYCVYKKSLCHFNRLRVCRPFWSYCSFNTDTHTPLPDAVWTYFNTLHTFTCKFCEDNLLHFLQLRSFTVNTLCSLNVMFTDGDKCWGMDFVRKGMYIYVCVCACVCLHVCVFGNRRMYLSCWEFWC